MICINCKREITRSYGAPHLMGNYCEHCATLLGLTPEQINGANQVVIHCDITQTFLNEYKAEIESETKAKVFNEINKLIQLLEFTATINAESVTIQGDNIPLLLYGLKKMKAENERLKTLFKPFNFKKEDKQ